MVKKHSTKSISTHIFFFLLFLVVPVLVALRPPGEPFLTVTRPFVEDMIANALYLGFFYVNYYILIPKFYFRHKYVYYGLYVLVIRLKKCVFTTIDLCAANMLMIFVLNRTVFNFR